LDLRRYLAGFCGVESLDLRAADTAVNHHRQ